MREKFGRCRLVIVVTVESNLLLGTMAVRLKLAGITVPCLER